ncbi:uncharacterized protein N0V89_008315 [Didymosphaeria variabile]|uniref:Uncharacterized protein n=1 Tax=Didymosphaeria variabile TaxID=1932322 RepID=A0A9W8XG01_9PLEO|nr:uncharacterized protein N0V89_008315 [Didymosphaeria variabile]KAJ4349698.1 hypothetical protein N0V89_008315 [Didymosphaeria variabile]
MTEPTPQEKLPQTLALIRAAKSPPPPIALSAVKKELKAFLVDIHQREEAHRDNKGETLKKWEAKAGVLEKKRIAGLDSNADEHDHMHAAGVPGHIMKLFREEGVALERDIVFFQKTVQQLKDLGFSSEDVKEVLSGKMDDGGEKDDKE